MSRYLMIAACCIALSGCSAQPDPREDRADAIEATASARADALEDEANTRAAALESDAANISDQARTTGGYDGERLKTRADALRREAAIVRRQGDARADAIETKGEGEAKTIRSQ